MLLLGELDLFVVPRSDDALAFALRSDGGRRVLLRRASGGRHLLLRLATRIVSRARRCAQEMRHGTYSAELVVFHYVFIRMLVWIFRVSSLQ